MKRCRRCDKDFLGGRNQVYCTPACRIAANEEAANKRKEEQRRARRKASNKRCVVCGAALSMYGHGNTCAAHVSPKPLSDILRQIRKKT